MLSVLACVVGLTPGCSRKEPTEFARLMNLGKAYLENRESAKAIEALNKALVLEPDSAPALRNLARAYRLARKPDQALVVLKRAATVEQGSVATPGTVATPYLMGLSLGALGRWDEAITDLEEAVRLDPQTATLRFQLANAYDLSGQYDKAVEQLHETLRLDPLHASAQFKLIRHARRVGDAAEVQRRLREFTRLRKLFGNETRTATALEQCRYTQPEPAPKKTEPTPRAEGRTIQVNFVDVTDSVFSTKQDRAAAAAAVIDVDADGRCTFFVADPQGGSALLTLSDNGTFERQDLDTSSTDHQVFRFDSCTIGDFHDDVPQGRKYDAALDALNDVLLSGPAGLRLLKRTGKRAFRDVTVTAGLGGIIANRAEWVDYEHDGDLDLLLARDDGLELWQNNGNETFTDVTTQVGLPQTNATSDVVAVDLDADVAVDIIAAGGDHPTLVFQNQRAGRFAAMAEPPGPWPPAQRVLANDLNNDGFPDSVLLREATSRADSKDEAIILLGRTPNRWRVDLSGMKPSAGVLVDYDNDGWLDLGFVGTSRTQPGKGLVRFFRNLSGSGVADVSQQTGLTRVTLPPVMDVIPADVDVDGDTDLMLVTSSGLRLLRNDGGQTNGQLKILLTTLKTNPSGLGTHIELRDRSWWVTRTVERLPIEIGLGSRRRLDSVQMVWTNGVVDNRVDVKPPTTPLSFVEKNVASGSCPFLYAWDGGGFRFVTDLLGNAPIGLSLSRGVMLPADPDEIVLIGEASRFPPRDGAYTVTITDEFREVLYLDDAKLLAVDHPAGIEVHPTDKLMSPPFPRSEVWALGSARKLIRAVGDDGIDRTAALGEIDGVFAPPGSPLPPPYRGMCQAMALTLDFGPLDSLDSPVLALTGWLQYGDASTNIAMSQNPTLTIIQPKLEVETSERNWHPIDVTVGMPVGKTKTILCDLTGQLPAGSRRLRLTTTFEIRWDRISLLERESSTKMSIHTLPASGANLQWRGFSQIKQRAPGHPTTPDFDTVSDFPTWRTALQGWCTRYGDVLDLVTGRDDRLVLLNSGDALTLRFDAQRLPPLPNGFTRTFFFYSVGWDKDGDHNVETGNVVEPLPMMSVGPAVRTNATNDRTDWRLQYNTRWVPRDRFRAAGDVMEHEGAARIRAESASDR